MIRREGVVELSTTGIDRMSSDCIFKQWIDTVWNVEHFMTFHLTYLHIYRYSSDTDRSLDNAVESILIPRTPVWVFQQFENVIGPIVSTVVAYVLLLYYYYYIWSWHQPESLGLMSWSDGVIVSRETISILLLYTEALNWHLKLCQYASQYSSPSTV